MNKFILTLLGTAIAGSAMASAPAFVAAEAGEEGPEFTFVTEPSSVILTPGSGTTNLGGFGQAAWGQKVSQAVCLDKTVTPAYAGCQITSISLITPGGNSNTTISKNPIKNATLFLTHDLNGEPFYTREVELPSAGKQNVTFNVEEPYTITGDEVVYVGYSLVVADNSVYIGYINRTATTAATNNVPVIRGCALIEVGEGDGYYDYSDSSVNALALGVGITGELPTGAFITGYQLPDIVSSEQGGTGYVWITNFGGSTINSAEIEYNINGVTGNSRNSVIQGTTNGTILPTTTGWVSFPISVNAETSGRIPVSFTLAKANGVDNAFAANAKRETDVLALKPGEGYPRALVLEEGTGTWCGYCPAGIVMMEELAELYSNTEVIRVAVHNGDDMAVSTYQPFITNYTPGLPGAFANRYAEIAPNSSSNVRQVQAAYEACNKVGSPMMIELEGELPEGARDYNLDVTVTPVYDLSNVGDRYRVAIVRVEDNVGPYLQTNYFSGSGQWGQWGVSESKVATIYNDVATRLDVWNGVEESLPVNLEGGKAVSYSTTMSNRGTLGLETRLVAMIVDTATGYIVNATQIDAPKQSGVETIAADNSGVNNAPVEFFNLQGQRVMDPANGIFIRRQGAEVTKVLVK